MGRYVPPDLEGRVSFNQASGKGHALGSRARKLASDGVLTVRFELPFAVWCTTCQPEQIIGQGVRFNAEKKKVGNYYSTPIWSFRMKHTSCGGWLEIHTDPQKGEYVVVEGGRRRDHGGLGKGDWADEGGQRVGATEEDKERLEREGGFGALEKVVDEKKEKMTQQRRIEELYKARARDWADPYERSQMLRREFRVGRRKRQEDARTGERLQEKYGIAVELLTPTAEDGEQAGQVDFGEIKSVDAASKSLFAQEPTPSKGDGDDRRAKGKQKSKEGLLADQKSALQSRLKDNTRTKHDPFLRDRTAWEPRTKRRKTDREAQDEGQAEPDVQPNGGLVPYASDSD